MAEEIAAAPAAMVAQVEAAAMVGKVDVQAAATSEVEVVVAEATGARGKSRTPGTCTAGSW